MENDMSFVEILLLALSLSADSFVVSMGGSVTLGRVSTGKTLAVAAVFGTVQAACLFAGWISGYSIVGYISRSAHYIALAVLSYLGISMVVAGVRNSSESVNLSGFRNLVLAAVTGLTLAVTVLASSAAITLGAASGRLFGNAARIAGGLVLIFIGVRPFIW